MLADTSDNRLFKVLAKSSTNHQRKVLVVY